MAAKPPDDNSEFRKSETADSADLDNARRYVQRVTENERKERRSLERAEKRAAIKAINKRKPKPKQ